MKITQIIKSVYLCYVHSIVHPVSLSDLSSSDRLSFAAVSAFRLSYESLSLFLQNWIPHSPFFLEQGKRTLPFGTPFPAVPRPVAVRFDVLYPCTIYERDCRVPCFSNRKPGWTHLGHCFRLVADKQTVACKRLFSHSA